MSEVQRINLRVKPYRGIWHRIALKEMVRRAQAGKPEVISPHRVRMGVKTGVKHWMEKFNETKVLMEQEYALVDQECKKNLQG